VRTQKRQAKRNEREETWESLAKEDRSQSDVPMALLALFRFHDLSGDLGQEAAERENHGLAVRAAALNLSLFDLFVSRKFS
jgi:hypothetical protein